jgi:hypothetical protein
LADKNLGGLFGGAPSGELENAAAAELWKRRYDRVRRRYEQRIIREAGPVPQISFGLGAFTQTPPVRLVAAGGAEYDSGDISGFHIVARKPIAPAGAAVALIVNMLVSVSAPAEEDAGMPADVDFTGCDGDSELDGCDALLYGRTVEIAAGRYQLLGVTGQTNLIALTLAAEADSTSRVDFAILSARAINAATSVTLAEYETSGRNVGAVTLSPIAGVEVGGLPATGFATGPRATIEIGWHPVVGADGYHLVQTDDTATAATVTTIADSGVTAATVTLTRSGPFDYTVETFVGAQTSSPTMTLRVDVRPSRLANFRVDSFAGEGRGTITVSLSWDAPDPPDNGIDGYKILRDRRQFGGVAAAQLTLALGDVTPLGAGRIGYTYREVLPGGSYALAAVAFADGRTEEANDIHSERSAVGSITVSATGMPDPPSGLTATPSGAGDSGEIALSWAQVGGLNSYQIERRKDGGEWARRTGLESAVSCASASCSVTDDALDGAGRYEYRLRTMDYRLQTMEEMDAAEEMGGIVALFSDYTPPASATIPPAAAFFTSSPTVVGLGAAATARSSARCCGR